MSGFGRVYRRWLRDRLVSTVVWTIGIVVIVVATAAFYPSLSGTSSAFEVSGGAMTSLLGLGQGINPASPLGYLWIGLYANIYPWMLMALGVALGVAAIAGDEDTGALEYLLSKPVTRTTVVFARYGAMVTTLAIVAVVSGLSLIVSMPLFDLTKTATITAADGTQTTFPGASITDVVNGTVSSFAVAIGLAGVAFLIGSATGRKGVALGAATALGVGGYVLYTLSNMTDSLGALTWLSPWRWYIADAMLINGLTWNVVLPFLTATVSLLVGWWAFLRRDLQSP
jgi:ABC-2 type transport system permease protein